MFGLERGEHRLPPAVEARERHACEQARPGAARRAAGQCVAEDAAQGTHRHRGVARRQVAGQLEAPTHPHRCPREQHAQRRIAHEGGGVDGLAAENRLSEVGEVGAVAGDGDGPKAVGQPRRERERSEHDRVGRGRADPRPQTGDPLCCRHANHVDRAQPRDRGATTATASRMRH